MTKFPRLLAIALALALHLPMLAACASQGAEAPVGQGFTAGSPAAIPATLPEYRIGPLDKLNIVVFQVKDLTLQGVQVDGSGQMSLPLVGSILAAGKTTQQLSGEIADRLRGKYLQDPQVSIWVQEAVSQKVTVDGAVREPGVYAMSGPTTLLQAVAMAKGPDNRLANLSRVAVFRTINGQRSAAVFDLKAIRAGKAEDPEIFGNDVVVVDGSPVKGAIREVLGALPALSIFRPY